MQSLYIHIPFCIKKCGYCDFLSVVYPGEKTVTRYVHALVREMSLYSGAQFDTVYIGGGTPSMLTLDQFGYIVDSLHAFYTLGPEVEFTVEANPESVRRDGVRVWKSSGVNRVSLGVQSFQDSVLEQWGRCTRRADSFNAVRILSEEGFGNLNIDLILGLQAQSDNGVELFKKDLAEAVALDPAHISVYILTCGKMKSSSGDREMEGFDEKTCENLYYHTDSFLSSFGYEHYEVSNFAKRGFASRHNMNYWTGGSYIGIGTGAVSTVQGRRVKNTEDMDVYIESAERGIKPVGETEMLGERECFFEKVMLSLRTSAGIEYTELVQNGKMEKSKLEKYVNEMCTLGYAKIRNGRLCLTSSGFFRSNFIISDILRFND